MGLHTSPLTERKKPRYTGGYEDKLPENHGAQEIIDTRPCIRFFDNWLLKEEYDALREITKLYGSTPEKEYVMRENVPYASRNITLSNKHISSKGNSTLKRYLTVSGYTLAYMGLPHLPGSISKLSELWYLDIRGNGLRELPESIGAMKELRVMRASDNQFTKFPDSIYGLRNITEIEVNGNPLEDPAEKMLKEMFGEKVIF
ncbi:Uncharacterised protein [uncultured archaeon]|nr:Uncharacterised protein [uncultured archaeon]